MFRFTLSALLVLPAAAAAQVGAYGLEIPNPPIRAQSGFNGLLLSNETEFLTPDGILDTLPPQQAYVPVPDTSFDTIEPAAGPGTSPTVPSRTTL